MCGRFAMTPKTDEVEKLVPGTKVKTEVRNRYNLAPTQNALIIRKNEGYEAIEARWGLIPFWAKDESIGNKLINARSETVATKPAFKNAFKKKRCLIVASGFFEWRKDKESGGKTPFFIKMKSGEPFTFAGLYDVWDKGDDPLLTTTILTGEPNELIKEIHNRAPIIVPESKRELWLDEEASEEELFDLFSPYSADEMEAYEVSKAVNNPRNDRKEIIERVDGEEKRGLFD